MKNYIYKLIILIGIILGFHNDIQAYITVPPTSYSLNVGYDQYLGVPNTYEGYIDHAVWTCSTPDISFKQKDEAGAIIVITKSFSGTGVVELLATEKYLDDNGRTRARTYYKQFLISCIDGGTSIEDSDIILPEIISLKTGETKQFNILSGNCYNGAFTLSWKEQSQKNFVRYSVNWSTSVIELSGTMPGEGVLVIRTADDKERECKITVTSSEVVSSRRTETVAVLDIKSLIANILPIAKTSQIETIIVENDDNNRSNQSPTDIYTIQGVLIKKNATDSDIISLPSGIYIIGNKKYIVN